MFYKISGPQLDDVPQALYERLKPLVEFLNGKITSLEAVDFNIDQGGFSTIYSTGSKVELDYYTSSLVLRCDYGLIYIGPVVSLLEPRNGTVGFKTVLSMYPIDSGEYRYLYRRFSFKLKPEHQDKYLELVRNLCL